MGQDPQLLVALALRHRRYCPCHHPHHHERLLLMLPPRRTIIRHCSCGHPCGFTIFAHHVGNTQTKTGNKLLYTECWNGFKHCYAFGRLMYVPPSSACTLYVATAAFTFNTQATWSWPAGLPILYHNVLKVLCLPRKNNITRSNAAPATNKNHSVLKVLCLPSKEYIMRHPYGCFQTLLSRATTTTITTTTNNTNTNTKVGNHERSLLAPENMLLFGFEKTEPPVRDQGTGRKRRISRQDTTAFGVQAACVSSSIFRLSPKRQRAS